MNNKKSTKRTLVTSVLSLVLCMAMLIGTTFAWFTDSVTSGNNKIQSGTLEVDLLVKDKTDGKYKSIKESEEAIFAYELWEPGYVEYANVQVKNMGTLALKYMMKVVATGEVSILADVIDVYFVYGEVTPTRESLATMQPVGTLRDVLESKDADGYLHGYLLANDNAEGGEDEAKATIALKMRETAGNEYQGLSIGSKFDINLIATQYTYESDSFDNTYDKDASFEERVEVTASNFADALAAIKDSNYDTVRIVLTEDVSWETGASHGSTPWVDAAATASTIIIEGNGHTVTATGDGVGPIRAANGANLVFENVKFVDESESYAEGSWEFGYLEFGGNLEFVDCTFVNAVAFASDSATFTNCSFNSNAENEYDAWVSNGVATFTGCTFEGYRGLKMHEDYDSEISSVVVDNCEFGPLSEKPGVAIGDVNPDTVVTIINSTFVDCQPGDQGKYIYESDTDVTTFVFTEENNTVVNREDIVEIATAEQLFAFAETVNGGNGMSGKLVRLTADIDLEGKEWTPIGQTGGYSAETYFQGTFDGQGYTISNLNVAVWEEGTDGGANYASGLFGFIDAADAVIKNVKVDGAVVTGHHWTGVIAGYITGSITGCEVKNATVTCTHENDNACGDKAGVITGYVNKGTVTNNTVTDCKVVAGRDAGQVAGAAKTTQVYDNTISNVSVEKAGNCTGAHIQEEEIGRQL